MKSLGVAKSGCSVEQISTYDIVDLLCGRAYGSRRGGRHHNRKELK